MLSDFVPLGHQNEIHMSGQLTIISKDEIVWGIFKFLTTTLMPLFFRQIKSRFGRTGPTFQWDHWSFRVPRGVYLQVLRWLVKVDFSTRDGYVEILKWVVVFRMHFPSKKKGKGGTWICCLDWTKKLQLENHHRINRTWTTNQTHAETTLWNHQTKKTHHLTSPNWTQNRSPFVSPPPFLKQIPATSHLPELQSPRRSLQPPHVPVVRCVPSGHWARRVVQEVLQTGHVRHVLHPKPSWHNPANVGSDGVMMT